LARGLQVQLCDFFAHLWGEDNGGVKHAIIGQQSVEAAFKLPAHIQMPFLHYLFNHDNLPLSETLGAGRRKQ